MNHKYVYPNVFMSTEDTKKISDLSADISKCINTAKADWVMNGFTDADWDKLQSDLDAYGLKDYLAIFQKYLDAYYALLPHPCPLIGGRERTLSSVF